MKIKKDKVNYDELIKYIVFVCLNNSFDSLSDYYNHINYLNEIKKKTNNKYTIIKVKEGINLINQKINEEKTKLYKPFNLENIK